MDGTERTLFVVGLLIVVGVLSVLVLRPTSVSAGVYTLPPIRPDAPGSFTEWTSSNVTLANWECVDEEIPNNETDYVYTVRWGKADSYNLQNTTQTEGIILNVRVCTYAKQTGVDEILRQMLVISGVKYYGAVDHTPTLNWALYTNDWAINPATNSSWTWSDINASEAGFESVKTAGWAGEIQVTQLYVEVTYKINIPPVAYDQAVTTEEDVPLNITLTGYDAEGDPLTFIIVTEPANGTLSGTPPNVTYTPDLNFYGNDSFTFKVNDGFVDSNVANVSITVTPVNDAPVVTDIPDVTFDEDTFNATIYLDDYVSDVETPPEEIIWSVSGNVSIIVDIDPITRVVNFSAPANWNGTETINFTATDTGDGPSPPLSDWDTSLVTVTPVNDAPVVSDIPDQTIVEDGTFDTISLDDYVDDVDNADSEITWTYSGNVNLTVSIGTDRVANITAPANWYGAETINFTATDPDGLSDSDIATFTVTSVNDAPVVTDIPNVTFDEDTFNATIDLDAYVSDVETPVEEIVWSVSGNVFISVDIDPATRLVNFSAPADWYGAETINFTATDTGSPPLSGWDTCLVTVTPVNDPPVLDPIGNKTVVAGAWLNFTAAASDVDNDTLTFSLGPDPPSGATITSDGNFSWKPTEAQVGNHTIRIIVSDPGLLEDYKDITVTVTPVLHDVAVYLPIALNATEVYPGWKINITVTVGNEGVEPETFWVAVYYNLTATEWVLIENQTVTLGASTNDTLTFIWDTTDVPPSIYTFNATAQTVPDEVDTDDNVKVGGALLLRLLGDVDDSGTVDTMDMLVVKIAITLEKTVAQEPFADLDGNGVIDVMDMLMLKIIITLAG